MSCFSWRPIGRLRLSSSALSFPALSAAATVSASPEAQAELVDLRRQLAGLETAAWTAAERESQGRSAAREALKDAAARAEEFGRAERARSEKLGALVQVSSPGPSDGLGDILGSLPMSQRDSSFLILHFWCSFSGLPIQRFSWARSV